MDKRKGNTDLTEGKVWKVIIRFALPLLIGNLLQQFYNITDSIIVGQFLGKEALAAVGTSNPLMTLAILFVNGMCIGASILMGTQYGAKKMDVLKRQISTTMMMSHRQEQLLFPLLKHMIVTSL